MSVHTDINLWDSFRRETVFSGSHLLSETTDNGDKPQWLEVDVWKTPSGNYVVQRATKYRIVHASEHCSKASGYPLEPSDPTSTFFCHRCNRHKAAGFTPEELVSVDVYYTVQDLLSGFKTDGRYNNFAKVILGDLAELDEAIDAVWTVRHVE